MVRGLVGSREAAHLLGCTPAGVRWLCSEGRIPAQKLGKSWAIPLEAVEHYRMEQRHRSLRQDEPAPLGGSGKAA